MKLFMLIFLIISCDDSPNTYITNPADTFLSYKFNLNSYNIGQENYSLSLIWSKYPNPTNTNAIDYNITLDPAGINQLTSTYDTTLTISNLNPGQFYPIIIQISPYLIDTIITFTKPLDIPLWISNNNETIIVPSFDGSENYLNWQILQSTFIDSIYIYSYNTSIDFPQNTTDNLWEKIATINPSTTNYTHQKNEFSDNFCYFISYTDIYENLSNSYISCDNGYQAVPPSIFNIEHITNNHIDKIIITLNEYNDTSFKSYILWRSSEQYLLDDFKIPITKSNFSNQLVIDDRYNVKDKTYYYQLEVFNQYGISSVSNIVSGSTVP